MPIPGSKPPRCLTPAALGKALGGHLPARGQRIGLLGGSFNPAHDGHRHISLEALRRLHLDEVWWLVSPQNPLKEQAGMAPLEARLDSARQVSRDPRLRATALETTLGTSATTDTLKALQKCFPQVNFVWLMGADNLAQIHRWQRWSQIFRTLPVAVLDRPSYSLSVLYAKAAQRFAEARIPERRAATLAGRSAPAWTFLHIRLNPLSATALRERRSEARCGAGTTGFGEGPAKKAFAPDKE
ncbi:nicotinate-nucleotide adenylyltransferase [Fodinicurvata halophila]|uniref:Probable nicotinate-nucleotide adenylyltransferase n=1 Tax=Fodinicurvata halophila TaxID=1419723 RepID=A0ABV8UHV7_9PROT